jgi:hypothetical protein
MADEGKVSDSMIETHISIVNSVIASIAFDIVSLFASLATATSPHSPSTGLGRALHPVPRKSQISESCSSYRCRPPRDG